MIKSFFFFFNLFLLVNRYASVMAIETPTKVDDEQWLAYWILYSFLTLTEMLLQSILKWSENFT